MKANQANFLALLQGNKQFIIPKYQRTYSWRNEQCQQLWDDIVQAGTTASIDSHFVGAVVYVQESAFQATGVPKLLVIDGQQRLTTIMLLLLALIHSVKNEKAADTVNADKLTELYVINKYESNDDTYKLLLTRHDNETLKALVDGRTLHSEQSQYITNNYQFFADKLQQGIYSAQQIYSGIGKLTVVDISLEPPKDNPQLIFESLNSTGMDLSQTDLIRNYVLMAVLPELQDKLYTTKWFPMEEIFNAYKADNQFDRFVRHYLTMKSPTGIIPSLDKIYRAFKGFHVISGNSSDALVEDLYYFARIYQRVALNGETDAQLKLALDDLNEGEAGSVTYPLLLKVFDDYERQLLTKADLLAILRLIESYIFRRSICNIATNSMNKTFASMRSKITDETNYLQSVEKAFMQLTGTQRLPRDNEFYQALLVKDVYNYQRKTYLLRKLENYNHREPISTTDYTIEHIMPQNPNLSASWIQDLGPQWQELQQKFLHTLGNLTLTAYNSELSDHSFIQKRDAPRGFQSSHLMLNEMLRTLDHWNADTIQERGQDLAKLAINVWPIPKEVTPNLSINQQESHNTIETLFERKSSDTSYELFLLLKQRILDLNPDIIEVIRRNYIVYKLNSNFVSVSPRKKKLNILLDIPYEKIEDPQHICRDEFAIDHWYRGTGEVAFDLDSSTNKLEYAIDLIKQSLRYQGSDVESDATTYIQSFQQSSQPETEEDTLDLADEE